MRWSDSISTAAAPSKFVMTVGIEPEQLLRPPAGCADLAVLGPSFESAEGPARAPIKGIMNTTAKMLAMAPSDDPTDILCNRSTHRP